MYKGSLLKKLGKNIYIFQQNFHIFTKFGEKIKQNLFDYFFRLLKFVSQ